MRMTKTKETWCPHCGYCVGAAGHLGSAVAQPGHFTVCIHCVQLSVFTDDMDLRPLTDDELKEAATNTEAQMVVAFLRHTRKKAVLNTALKTLEGRA